jgi:hypothetical protein
MAQSRVIHYNRATTRHFGDFMKWKIEGTDASGDDVIVIVEADDTETATRQATFAGVKVKAVHAEAPQEPAVKLPPKQLVNPQAALGKAPPGYTGKVIVEREDDESGAKTHFHLPTPHLPHVHISGDVSGLGVVITQLVALVLAVIGVVVFICGWILYGRAQNVLIPPDDSNSISALGNQVTELVAQQHATSYMLQMLMGLTLIIVAMMLENFVTRMIKSIRETWGKRES